MTETLIFSNLSRNANITQDLTQNLTQRTR